MATYRFRGYDDVRAVLGVSLKELPDSVLAQGIYTNRLLLDLRAEGATIVEDYLAAGETVADLNFTLALDTLAVYLMASYCISGLPQFSPKSITDGKAMFSRHADSPYLKTIERVNAELYAARLTLRDYYATQQGSSATAAAPRTLVAASTPTIDTITGV